MRCTPLLRKTAVRACDSPPRRVRDTLC